MVSLSSLIPDLARPLCKLVGWKCCLFLGRCPVMSSSDCRAPDLTISGDKKPCESARVCMATHNPEDLGGVCKRTEAFSLLMAEFREVNGVA